jgi:hypothetical protein
MLGNEAVIDGYDDAIGVGVKWNSERQTKPFRRLQADNET